MVVFVEVPHYDGHWGCCRRVQSHPVHEMAVMRHDEWKGESGMSGKQVILLLGLMAGHVSSPWR